MTFWTQTLSSGSITINASDYAYFVSIQANTSSSCTVLGGIPFQGVNPSAVNIAAGEGINLSAPSNFSPLSGITITWVSGTIDVVVGF